MPPQSLEKIESAPGNGMASEGFNPKIWYGIHRGWRMRGSGSQAARTGKPPPFSSVQLASSLLLPFENAGNERGQAL